MCFESSVCYLRFVFDRDCIEPFPLGNALTFIACSEIGNSGQLQWVFLSLDFPFVSVRCVQLGTHILPLLARLVFSAELRMFKYAIVMLYLYSLPNLPTVLWQWTMKYRKFSIWTVYTSSFGDLGEDWRVCRLWRGFDSSVCYNAVSFSHSSAPAVFTDIPQIRHQLSIVGRSLLQWLSTNGDTERPNPPKCESKLS
jgi:hypothetical protein